MPRLVGVGREARHCPTSALHPLAEAKGERNVLLLNRRIPVAGYPGSLPVLRNPMRVATAQYLMIVQGVQAIRLEYRPSILPGQLRGFIAYDQKFTYTDCGFRRQAFTPEDSSQAGFALKQR